MFKTKNFDFIILFNKGIFNYLNNKENVKLYIKQ